LGLGPCSVGSCVIIYIIMPASFVFRTNQGKAYTADTYFIFGKPAPVTINSVVASASPNKYPVTVADVSGTSITNGINYNVLSFASVSTTTSYTVNYTCNSATTIYVLAVGGGGGGGTWLGGGGGAGGVVMMPIYLQSGTNQTISISVGAGGSGATSSGSGAANGQTGGYNTTVMFNPSSSSSIPIIIASGGGSGGCNNNLGGVINSSGTISGGGGSGYGYSATSPSPANNNNYNFANGGAYASGSGSGGGGGGAGTIGQNSFVNGPGVNGGNGIQCYLPGINNFSPSGTSYGTYYWGGGGGSAGNNSPAGPGGNGGLGGGGGGGGGLTSQNGGVGGTGGINLGYTANANPNYGGAGGANTGGGGGATYGAAGGTVSGAGGSGIVIIAFPSATALTNNQAAVLPASIYSNSVYSAVLNNATLSSLAYNSIKGAFACRLLNYNYFGPVMTLRYSTDTTGINTQNFYADVFGNLGTQYLGTGQSVSAWLSANSANTTYAYVAKWYGQGMDVSFNAATQYITTAQPVYEVPNGVINFGYTTGYTLGTNLPSAWARNAYFYLPNGAYPYADASSSIINRLWNFAASGWIAAGGTTTDFFQIGSNTGSSWMNYYGIAGTAYNSTTTASAWATPNQVVSVLYTSGQLGQSSVNFNNSGAKNAIGGGSSAARTTSPLYNWIGSAQGNTAQYFGNHQLYNMYIFNSSLTDADRLLVEATPYTYSASATTTIAGLSATNITSTNFSLSWTALASPNYYILWINGSMYGSYTAGSAGTYTTTVTPGVSGPWTVNLYAYNSSNVLLASGTTATGFRTTTLNVTSWYNPDNITMVSGCITTYPDAIGNYSMNTLTGTAATTFAVTTGTFNSATVKYINNNGSGLGVYSTNNTYYSLTNYPKWFIFCYYTSGTGSNNYLINEASAFTGNGFGDYSFRYVTGTNPWTNPDIQYGNLAYYINGTAGTVNVSPTAGSWNIVSLNVGDPNTIPTINGFKYYFAQMGLFANQRFTSVRAYSGYMGDLFVSTSSSFTDNSRQVIEGYLAWKYGIQGSLPAGHPYKSSAPGPIVVG